MTTKQLDAQTVEGTLKFLVACGALKDTLRSGHTDGGHLENTAAHSWRLALWVIALEPYLAGYNVTTLLKLAILHDLGEAITGDVPAIHQHGDQSARQAAERAAVHTLSASLDSELAGNITALAADYDGGLSKEAKLMKGLDKLETMLQHITAEDPATFDYQFNLGYGRAWTDQGPLLPIIRARIDALTQERIAAK
ncbi:MAG: HD family hydrolase [Devosiaceae bacterium]